MVICLLFYSPFAIWLYMANEEQIVFLKKGLIIKTFVYLFGHDSLFLVFVFIYLKETLVDKTASF